jgi:hypothetical protein
VDVSLVVALRVLALGTLAAASATARAAPPDDLVTRPLVLAPGAVELRLTASINVQVRSISVPLSLAPDAWWGVLPRLTIGLTHSDASLDQIATSGSFCIRQSAISTCDHFYHGSGLDVRYGALDGDLALAPRLRLLVRETDPFKPAITLGALVRWAHGRFAIASDPYLRLPLANHELGNASAIMLPLWLEVQPAPGWLIALHTGFDADLVVLRDGGHGAFGVEVTARARDNVDIGVSAGWGSLLGPQHDARHGTAMVTVAWRP